MAREVPDVVLTSFLCLRGALVNEMRRYNRGVSPIAIANDNTTPIWEVGNVADAGIQARWNQEATIDSMSARSLVGLTASRVHHPSDSRDNSLTRQSLSLGDK